MAQDLVNWLWAFLFWVIGLNGTLNAHKALAPPTWIAVMSRIVMLSVGGAALILCSLAIWREFRTVRATQGAQP